MTPSLREHVAAELTRHHAARATSNVVVAWTALERAHVLSQPLLGPHLSVHVAMLGYALSQRDPREALGQLVRLALAPLGYLTGRTPAGNTGRAGVSAFATMPVPDDLAALLRGLGPATTNVRADARDRVERHS